MDLTDRENFNRWNGQRERERRISICLWIWMQRSIGDVGWKMSDDVLCVEGRREKKEREMHLMKKETNDGSKGDISSNNPKIFFLIDEEMFHWI